MNTEPAWATPAGFSPLPSFFTASDSTLARRTTRIAAFVPGGGQILNQKYWKAPIVWGGIAWCVSLIDFNTRELKKARTNLIQLELSGQPNPIDLLNAREAETFYRTQRDVSWFALAGVHLLSILDAHVDANLLAFDVSEDLSMEVAPMYPSSSSHYGPHTAALGLVLRWELPSSKFTKFAR